MSRELFGTDGVRGVAGVYPLDREGCIKMGRAIGTLFAEENQTVVFGCDPRESSKEISENILKGLNAVGVNVIDAGVLPTPAIAFLTRQSGQFAAGIMITASHNPFNYNGVKVFDSKGDKLTDEVEAKLNNLIEAGVPDRGAGTTTPYNRLLQQYEDFLVNSAGDLNLNSLSIAIDSANGAASGIAQRVFERLGATVTPLFDKPDGRNINDGCGATDVKALAAEVVSKKLSLGVALDGDADRIIMIDDLGREVKGDYIMYILAVSLGLKGVVATVMSNLGFEAALNDKGIALERTKVGDRYVLEGLAATSFKLGGEQSGHIILPDLLKTGDAMLAAVQTVKAINSSDKTLSQWCDEVELLPQSIVNIPLEDKSLLESPKVADLIKKETDQFGQSGRLFVRASGTEPLLRVMVEASDADNIAQRVADELKTLLGGK